MPKHCALPEGSVASASKRLASVIKNRSVQQSEISGRWLEIEENGRLYCDYLSTVRFVRLVELVTASAISATMKETIPQIHYLTFHERRSIVTLKTRYEEAARNCTKSRGVETPFFLSSP